MSESPNQADPVSSVVENTVAGLFAAGEGSLVGRRESLSAHRTRHASAPSSDVLLVDDTSTEASSDDTFVKHETSSGDSLFDEIARDLSSDVGLTPRTNRLNTNSMLMRLPLETITRTYVMFNQ